MTATYAISCAGSDLTLDAESAEDAAREAAAWQWGDDGRHVVTLEWLGRGPDAAVAEYRAARLYDGRGEPEDCGRVTVRPA